MTNYEVELNFYLIVSRWTRDYVERVTRYWESARWRPTPVNIWNLEQLVGKHCLQLREYLDMISHLQLHALQIRDDMTNASELQVLYREMIREHRDLLFMLHDIRKKSLRVITPGQRNARILFFY
jgi:hypothetical protein